MRTTGQLPSAFEALDDIARQLQTRRLAVFLDYDGTLTSIVNDPAQALLPPATTVPSYFSPIVS